MEKDFEQTHKQELENYQQHYSSGKFWVKIRSIGKQAGEKVVYYALLLYYVLKSPDVPLRHKGLIIGAWGYLILPADLVPDAIPLLGFSDDVSALYFVVQTVRSSITPAIEKQAELKVKEIFHQTEDEE